MAIFEEDFIELSSCFFDYKTMNSERTYLFGGALTDHRMIDSSVLLVASCWILLSIASIIQPRATSLIQTPRRPALCQPPSGFATLLIAGTSAPSVAVSCTPGIMLGAAPVRGRHVATKVGRDSPLLGAGRFDFVDVSLERIGYLGLVALHSR